MHVLEFSIRDWYPYNCKVIPYSFQNFQDMKIEGMITMSIIGHND